MRINWDYAIGVVMGALVVTACKKTYEAGIKEGYRQSKVIHDIADGDFTDIVDEVEKEVLI